MRTTLTYPNGVKNRLHVHVKRVVLKPGKMYINIMLAYGVTVRAFTAGKVKHICVRHELRDIQPPTFNVETQQLSFTAQIECGMTEERSSMKGQQFPLICNSTATTSRKLQGCTAKSLYAME